MPYANSVLQSSLPRFSGTTLAKGYVTSQFVKVATQATPNDAQWSVLPAVDCACVILMNNTGVSVDVLRAGTDANNVITIPTGTGYTFDSLTRGSELSVRRNDQDGTKASVTLQFEAKS